jgi:hypothetical protein
VVAGHAINVGRRGTDGFWRSSSPTKQFWKRSVTPVQNSSSELHPTGSVRGPKSGLGVAGTLHQPRSADLLAARRLPARNLRRQGRYASLRERLRRP